MSDDAARCPVDAYLERFAGEARATLEELRALLRQAVPGASETMAYGVPTLDLHGVHVLRFAGFARHVGLYPRPSGMAGFDDELSRYEWSKGSVWFPLGARLPVDLIRRIAALQVAEVEAQAAARRRPARALRERHAMPEVVREALETEGLMDAYLARPPYQRNDYLGWIARAKREETRARRLRQMLDELAGGRSYMGMPWRSAGRGA